MYMTKKITVKWRAINQYESRRTFINFKTLTPAQRKAIKDSTYTKTELDRELKISGLEAEKRMIQATDRKLLDVRRQTEIEEEIKRLNKK